MKIWTLRELWQLEVVNLYQVPVNNLEVLLQIPSLKIVIYEPKTQGEESILQELERKGVTVYRKYTKEMYLLVKELKNEAESFYKIRPGICRYWYGSLCDYFHCHVAGSSEKHGEALIVFISKLSSQA